MLTLRHIERLFDAGQFRRLCTELLAGRAEDGLALELTLGRAVPVAAMALIRVDEFNQSHAPLYRRLLGVVLTSQQPDGSFGDPMTTALCVRALACGGGQGAAVERGLASLASLQKSEGVWPREPLRRMPADALASAFILMQLASHERFRRAVRFADAVDWFRVNAAAMDPDARRLWSHTAPRCRIAMQFDHADALWLK